MSVIDIEKIQKIESSKSFLSNSVDEIGAFGRYVMDPFVVSYGNLAINVWCALTDDVPSLIDDVLKFL